MCESHEDKTRLNAKTISVQDAVGTVLAHDITEITPGQFKGRAFKKGHVIRQEDVCSLQRLGKDKLFVLDIANDEMHEDDAAYALANALMGGGVKIQGEPKEGKINIVAGRNGLLKINKEALLAFNMLEDVMCATLHDNTVVREGQTVAGTRAIPLVVKRKVVEEAIRIIRGPRSQACLPDRQGVKDSSEPHLAPPLAKGRVGGAEPSDPRILEPNSSGVIEVKEMRKPKAGVVITGNEVYYGRIKDAFGPIIQKKIEEYGGEVAGVYFAPDDESYIEARLRELIDSGCDLLITTGGMSVDPDDVTRFAITKLGSTDIAYGSAVLPGAMFLVAYIEKGSRGSGAQGSSDENAYSLKHSNTRTPACRTGRLESCIPVLGIPACGMYHKTTIFDLMLPRVLAGERIGREELAELGHGGLCMNCEVCRYPVCPFGK